MPVISWFRPLCLAILIPVLLSGCIPDDEPLTGYWRINEPGCLSLCAFTISIHPETKKPYLTFDDDDSVLAISAKGEFRHEKGNEYSLVFPGGGEIGFTVINDKLVAEEGSVFEKLPYKVEIP